MLLQPSRIKPGTIYQYATAYDLYMIWPFMVGDTIRLFRGKIYDQQINSGMSEVDYDSRSRTGWTSREVEVVRDPETIRMFASKVGILSIRVIQNIIKKRIPFSKTFIDYANEFPTEIKKQVVRTLFREL